LIRYFTIMSTSEYSYQYLTFIVPTGPDKGDHSYMPEHLVSAKRKAKKNGLSHIEHHKFAIGEKKVVLKIAV